MVRGRESQIGQRITTVPAAFGVAAILGFAAFSPTTAQELMAADHGPRMATRDVLTAMVDSFQNVAMTFEDGSNERVHANLSAQAISRRLREGDVWPGDVVQLSVVGEERWTNAHTVTPNRTLALEAIDPIDVSGVLHSELEERISLQLGRYLRDPRIQVDVLKRIGITGYVARPGFYTVPGNSLVSDALMLAGGPGSSSNINTIEFRRLGAPIGVPSHVVWQSMSLDDLGVQSGDEMFVPQSGSSLGRFLIAALGVALTVTLIAIRIF
jgi:protein involved in polysaccharide export with SLBB domain